jgi:mRNA-degrading endonuclease toxin of MazEF toxin-antitoxin module
VGRYFSADPVPATCGSPTSTQPRVSSENSGLRRASFARPEDVRSTDGTRLQRRLGTVSHSELSEIRKVLRYFLDL